MHSRPFIKNVAVPLKGGTVGSLTLWVWCVHVWFDLHACICWRTCGIWCACSVVSYVTRCTYYVVSTYLLLSFSCFFSVSFSPAWSSKLVTYWPIELYSLCSTETSLPISLSPSAFLPWKQDWRKPHLSSFMDKLLWCVAFMWISAFPCHLLTQLCPCWARNVSLQTVCFGM